MIASLLGGILALLTSQPARPMTFAGDIAPIIQSRCGGCHRPGGDAPFSLETIDEVRHRASMIVTVTKSRYMPPWKPVPGFGEFQDSRRMPDAEITAIERWVAGGMLEGTAAAEQPAPRLQNPWERGEPDLVIELPAYTLGAGGADVFRNFVVPNPAVAGRIVRGLQFRTQSHAVHHANIRVDVTPASRQLDQADPEPGYEGLIARSADFPDGQFLGWTPGQLAPVLSDESSWRLAAGSDFVVQLHLRPTGAVEQVRPVIGLYFGEREPRIVPVMIRLGKQDLDIPANAASHRVIDSFVLPVAINALAIQAHAHHRARSVEAWAMLPDGSRQPLLRIDDWDVNWQDRYVYTTPVRLPAGTRLTSAYVFDNSNANPRNPDRPPARATWGWRSSDEMADVWLQVTTASVSDRAILQRDITTKMLADDAVGSEVLLRREPNHVALHNDAAQIYLALGQPERARAHFAAVRQLWPAAAAAWFNEATALEALGRIDEASARYQEALRLDPSYSPAQNNAGTLLLRGGRIAEARAAFDRAVAADPNNAGARANLALAMIAMGDADAALAQARQALAANPDLLAAMTPFVLLLAANADSAARRPADARALAERIVQVSKDHAAALDGLAVCQAALGAFEQAVRTAGAALSAAPAGSPLRDAIRTRIALYQNRQPFVLQR